jgi:hypothetical protein
MSTLCTSASRYRPHAFFANKRMITAATEDDLREILQPFVRVQGLQLLRTDVARPFEEAMMTSALVKMRIVEAEKFKRRRAVEFRTIALAARYAYVATVATARGAAGARQQRGRANAALTRQTVAAEVDAFANVSEGLGARVTPREVLDYAYWQFVVGDSAPGLRTRLPLHDILLGRRTEGVARRSR